MGEVANRVTGVVANTAGNTVGPVVSALMVTAGIATGHPELAAWAIPGGALAGSLTTEGVALVGQALNDRARRVDQFARAAEEAAGRPIEDLMAQAAEDDPLRTLLAQTVEAASGSHNAWKIETLARAFVHGAKDGTKVEEMLLLVDMLAPLEVVHVRLMRVIYEIEANGSRYRTGLEHAVRELDADLADVYVLLFHKLLELRIVIDEDPVREVATPGRRIDILTPLGRYLANVLERLGSLARPQNSGGGSGHTSPPAEPWVS